MHAPSHYLLCAPFPHWRVDRQVMSEQVQSMTWSLETRVGAEGVRPLDLIIDSQVPSLNSPAPRGAHSKKLRYISSIVIHFLSSSWNTQSLIPLLHLTRLAVLIPLHVYTVPLSNNSTAPAKFISSSCPARCHHPMLSFPRTPLLLLWPLFLWPVREQLLLYRAIRRWT